MQETNSQEGVKNTPLRLTLHKPFSTFVNGKPQRIPYLVDGLLPDGAFSVLAGKPKHGKSSLARYEAVCVAKGHPFLGRDTERGEVLLISLEDPLNHVDNCLGALGYDDKADKCIHTCRELLPRVDDSIDAIEREINDKPTIRLVIIDHLAKLLRVDDLNDYAKVQPAVGKLSALARRHPHLHIQGLVHSKKRQTDDAFDSVLGSTALRGEPDSTIVLYGDAKQRVIEAETRIGRAIPATLLCADTIVSAGAQVVSAFSLGMPFDDWQKSRADKAERKRAATHEERIIAFVKEKSDKSATQSELLKEVKGRTETKLDAIQNLISRGVLIGQGTPKTLHLNETAIDDFINAFAGDGGADE